MKLYLLRHGESECQAATDAQRQLTQAGQQEARDVAAQFALRGIHLDRCICSPYERARQTASLFLSALGDTPDTEYNDILVPERRAAEVMTFLDKITADHVLLVSHNPLLSELNAMLVEGNINSMMILGTCELSAIDAPMMANGVGTRSFFLSPPSQY